MKKKNRKKMLIKIRVRMKTKNANKKGYKNVQIEHDNWN